MGQSAGGRCSCLSTATLGRLSPSGKRYVFGDYFTGSNALREFKIFAPAGAPTAIAVPLETTGGAGTAGGHWLETVFGNELMTGFIDRGVNPISRITVGAFQDMGYTVNYNLR